MMKRIKAFVAILLFFSLAFGITKGASDVCSSYPEELKTYKEYVMGAVKDLKIEKEEGVVGAVLGVFEGGSMGVMTSIFTLPDTISNFLAFGSLYRFFLSKPDEIVRDYRLVMNLDEVIKDKILEIGFKGKFFHYPSGEVIESINSRAGENMIFDIKIGENISYLNLSEFLRELNSLYKAAFRDMLQGNGPKHFQNEIIFDLVDRYQKNSISISLNEKVYNSLKKKYDNIGSCPGTWSDFKSNVNDTWNVLGEGWTESKSKIGKSVQRLKGVYGSTFGGVSEESMEAYEERKKEVMKKYGAGGEEEEQDSWLGAFRNYVSDRITLNTDLEDLEPLKEDVASISSATYNYFFGAGEDIDPYDLNKKLDTNVGAKKSRENFINRMNKAGEEVLSMEADQIGDIIKDSPKGVTGKFPGLSKAVYEAKSIVGGKDTDNSIIKFMGKACEKQCSNLGGICRYY